ILKAWDKQQKKKRLLTRTASLAALFMLVAVLVPANGAIFKEKAARPAAAVEAEAPSVGVVFVPKKEREPMGSALNALGSVGKEAPLLTIAARLEEEAGWRKWTGNTKLLMAIGKENSSSKLQVSM